MADTIVVFVLTRHWVLGASYDCPRLVHCARSHNQLGRLDFSTLQTSHGARDCLLIALVVGQWVSAQHQIRYSNGTVSSLHR